MLSRSSDTADALIPDPLSEVLQDLRISGGSYGRCALTSPWGIDFPSQRAARFHFVAEGQCWLHTAALGWIPLRAGDVVLLPQGTAHTLADTPGAPSRPLGELRLEPIGQTTYRLRAGGAGRPSLLFCCSVSFEDPTIHPLLELMPVALVVCGAACEDATLPLLLDTMAEEVLAQRIGAATMLTRLADVVITRVIRAWVEAQCEKPSGWLAAIRDPHIGRALAAIHRRPGHEWSVEALADIARASRSMFSERFTSVVGMPPARYLARWRMHVASGWLRHERLSVAEVAARLGYESEASFSRAFKRHVGVPPSTLRRVDRQVD